MIRLSRALGYIALWLVTLLVILWAALNHDVRAHGEYDWIGGMKNKRGELCCGPNDCFRVRAAEVHNGWYVYSPTYKPGAGGGRIDFFPHGDQLDSRDGHPWACYELNSDGTLKRLRCFLMTPPGV